MTPNLFRPIKVGGLELGHRVVMAPLTRYRSPNHVPSSLQEIYYEQRSRFPGTLIITEATFISKAAGGYDNVPGIYSSEQVEEWKRIFRTIHTNKSSVFVQLWALGREANPEVLEKEGLPYVSASANLNGATIVPQGESVSWPLPKSLTIEEIKKYITDYTTAAKNAIVAGADGVEIHMANGYLLEQFLYEGSNERLDEYGGSIESRARFPLQVLDSIIKEIGADRVGVRLSPWRFYTNADGSSPIPTWGYLVEEFEKRARQGNKLAYIHLIEPRGVLGSRPNMKFNDSGDNSVFTHIWSGQIIRAGGYSLRSAIDEAERNEKELIGIGRYFISTPNLVERWKNGLEPNAYDRSTFYIGGTKGYTDYPF